MAAARTIPSIPLPTPEPHPVQRGCDGVEADNVDGFENATGFPLTAADQLQFNRTLYNEAHSRGLAVAMKNDVGQIADLLEYVDLHVSERCHEFDECGLLDPFIAPVFERSR